MTNMPPNPYGGMLDATVPLAVYVGVDWALYAVIVSPASVTATALFAVV